MKRLEELAAREPIPFRDFMEIALYDPEHGYYRRGDPFGRSGDFYTAEQVQPVFGILIAQRIRRLEMALGSPGDFTVVELGAGRREMAQALSDWRYLPVEYGQDLPKHFTGVVFSNEFFDALPVEAVAWKDGEPRRMLVSWNGSGYEWVTGPAATAEIREYLAAYFPSPEEGCRYEVNLEALRWLERIAQTLDRGYVLSIDYGYTAREWARFPQGSLMSYRRHTATANVLEAPGRQDITAHVNFTALERHGASVGLIRESYGTLARTLLEAGEPDGFAAALEAAGPAERVRRNLQLKTLLVGMGESFRTLLQRKEQ